MSVVADVAAGGPGADPARVGDRGAAPADRVRDLRAEALRDPVVQSLLDVIPAELRDVTELKDP